MNKHGGYYGRQGVVDYSVNINPLGVSDNIRQAIISSIDNICKYPDIGGNAAKKAISKHLNTDIQNIVMGNGASELIYLYARAIQPKKVLIIEPTFNEYRRAFTLAGSEIYSYILDSNDDFTFDIDAFCNKVEEVKPDVVVLCNPNNPTGKYIGIDLISKIVDIVKQENSFLFIDESFVEFTGNDPIGSVIGYEWILSLRSMTKYYAVPGLRIGYAVSNEKVIEMMERYKEPWTMNTFALDIVPKVIEDMEFHRKVMQWVTGEREFMYDALRKVDILKVYKSYSNFFLCELKYFSGNKLNEELLKDDMFVRVCDDFVSLSDRFVRIALKGREDNIKLVSRLVRV